MTRVANASDQPDQVRRQNTDVLCQGFAGQEGDSNHAVKEAIPSSFAATLTLRVAEARVDDIGHAIARLAPSDLRRIGAQAGDVLKITGSTIGFGRAEPSNEGHAGMIQIDGTCRSNCGVGLQEQVTVARVEHEQAVAVRFSPL
jgi:hypothetical protein